MGFEAASGLSMSIRSLTVAMVVLVLSPAAWSQSAGGSRGSIFSCTVDGKLVRSDREIPNCTGEQRELFSDGSFKRIVPPRLSPEERANQDERARQVEVERAGVNDAIRRDRNLMLRYPNEARHAKARAEALDDSRTSVRRSEARIALLSIEQKKLRDEAEFYPDKQKMPLKLKQDLDANEAALAAQRSLAQNQNTEISRINANFDAELAHLRKLWGGAVAGSLGPVKAAASGAETPGGPSRTSASAVKTTASH